jgi:hypothetical protein
VSNISLEVPIVVDIWNLAGYKAYEMEDDVTKDLFEFSLANAIFAALVEAHACEQSARYEFYIVPLIYPSNSNLSPVEMQWTMHPRTQVT